MHMRIAGLSLILGMAATMAVAQAVELAPAVAMRKKS